MQAARNDHVIHAAKRGNDVSRSVIVIRAFSSSGMTQPSETVSHAASIGIATSHFVNIQCANTCFATSGFLKAEY